MDRKENADNLRLGISTCLLGEPVRYDGGHKLDPFLRDTLGRYVEYVPVCPEVECGLGVPREAMRLVGRPDSPRLVTVKTKRDFTERMERWARRRVVELEREGLCGFIFKGGSPSSGMERVKVYDEKGVPVKIGVGIFAREFMEHFPLIPVEEEGRLHDPALRENFIERIFTWRRWRKALSERSLPRAVVDFQSRNKLLVMSHSPKHLREMGRLAADPKDMPAKELAGRYQTLLMEAMGLKATPRKHTNVLMHMMGYFKRNLDAPEKQELLEIIEAYRRELIPLIVPVTLIGHYVRKYNQPYLRDQTYLNPHPLELRLRNHV
ncbi:MAG: DUF523 and DUF1722 domain-containing protein [Deltaproteobacteria bacterium]|nr:DUF523 and DUF1722 domain-containing protein [Deltaproteobacteria bacterium]